jgi:hypothetical protein
MIKTVLLCCKTLNADAKKHQVKLTTLLTVINKSPPIDMKKTIGVLCLSIFVASLGWKLTQSFMTSKSEPSLVDVGYLHVSDGSVLEFKNGTASISGSGKYSIKSPINYKIDLGIYLAASAACLLAGITLLKKEKA